jgi:hypothetical protein
MVVVCRIWRVALVSSALLALGGCGLEATTQSAPPHHTLVPTVPASPTVAMLVNGPVASDGGVPPVIVHNPAPGTLSVDVSVEVNQGIQDTQSMTDVGLGFYQGQNVVQFAGSERVTCNGTDLPLKDRAAFFELIHAPTAQVVGMTVRCAYAAGGTVAAFAVQLPEPPAITSPTAGAHVSRAAQTIVTYRCDPASCTLRGIVALATDQGKPGKTIAQLETPGPQQATLDTSILPVGPGSIVLTGNMKLPITTSGAAFASTSGTGDISFPVAVTWI